MISAKQAKNKTNEIIALAMDIEIKKFNQYYKQALKETLPSVLREIEKEIKDNINEGKHGCYFRLLPWMDGEYLHRDIEKILENHGYNVSVDVYTPTEGGDSENGNYGDWRTGPDEYTLVIQWDMEK